MRDKEFLRFQNLLGKWYAFKKDPPDQKKPRLQAELRAEEEKFELWKKEAETSFSLLQARLQRYKQEEIEAKGKLDSAISKIQRDVAFLLEPKIKTFLSVFLPFLSRADPTLTTLLPLDPRLKQEIRGLEMDLMDPVDPPLPILPKVLVQLQDLFCSLKFRTALWKKLPQEVTLENRLERQYLRAVRRFLGGSKTVKKIKTVYRVVKI